MASTCETAPYSDEKAPELSIVVPAYNEESGLREFHARLSGVMQRLGHAYEVVYVDASPSAPDMGLTRY